MSLRRVLSCDKPHNLFAIIITYINRPGKQWTNHCILLVKKETLNVKACPEIGFKSVHQFAKLTVFKTVIKYRKRLSRVKYSELSIYLIDTNIILVGGVLGLDVITVDY